MSNPEETQPTSVVNAEHVDHADHVDNSVQTEIARVVTHADTVGTVEVHGEPLRTTRERTLNYVREIARWFVVLFALTVMIVVIVDKNINEDALRRQITTFQLERTATDTVISQKLECTRRYQDVIDAATEKQLILIGELTVVITRIPPGPDREAAVTDKIALLDQTNIDARKSV